MSAAENNCTWHFGIESGRSEGPFDATGQNFRQRPYASLIREAVQNSMDAYRAAQEERKKAMEEYRQERRERKEKEQSLLEEVKSL